MKFLLLLNFTQRQAALLLFRIILAMWLGRKWHEKKSKAGEKPRTKNKKRFSIDGYKYAMKNVKADYLLECRPLQMEKEKLNAVIVEEGVSR